MKIPLFGCQVQIDESDAVLLIQHRWSVKKERHTRYARTQIDGKYVYMHRLLLGSPEGFVDHINGDGLDNRRENLRVANQSQQNQNSIGHPGRRKSRYKGVFWWRNPKLASGGYWIASVTVNGNGFREYFRTEIEAAMRYNEMAKEHFGEFARLNIIEEAA
jgi:hypothetical protein